MTNLNFKKFIFKVMKFLGSLRCVKESMAGRIVNTSSWNEFPLEGGWAQAWRYGKELRHPRAAAVCRSAIWSGRLLEVSLGRCTTHVQLSGDPEADSWHAGRTTLPIKPLEHLCVPPEGLDEVAGDSVVWASTQTLVIGGKWNRM